MHYVERHTDCDLVKIVSHLQNAVDIPTDGLPGVWHCQWSCLSTFQGRYPLGLEGCKQSPFDYCSMIERLCSRTY